MPSNPKDRERFAPLFGITRLRDRLKYLCVSHIAYARWEQLVNDTVKASWVELPDFCDIRGPHFGPACEEMLQARYRLSIIDGLFCWQCGDGNCYSDAKLGLCTMLALEAKHAREACSHVQR